MKKLLSLILSVTLILTTFTSCEAIDKALASTYLNLGEKYLDDFDYENAIVYFNKLIDVEPDAEAAYLGLAEAYIALDDIDSAIDILEQGIAVVADAAELEARLEELSDGQVVSEESTEYDADYSSQYSYLFTTVDVDNTDLGTGSLILVNSSHPLMNEVSEDDLINIYGEKASDVIATFADYDIDVYDGAFLLSDAMEATEEMTSDHLYSDMIISKGYQPYSHSTEINDEDVDDCYYEHHTGLSIDFQTVTIQEETVTVAGIEMEVETCTYGVFDGTGEYSWVPENCYKFGYILRYPEGKEEYTLVESQPWHYRYVGIPHAQIMYEYDMCLEEYISFIKNYTIASGFLSVSDDDGNDYLIYYVPMSDGDTTTIYIPLQDDGVTAYPYEISGNNIDGFIVTVKL